MHVCKKCTEWLLHAMLTVPPRKPRLCLTVFLKPFPQEAILRSKQQLLTAGHRLVLYLYNPLCSHANLKRTNLSVFQFLITNGIMNYFPFCSNAICMSRMTSPFNRFGRPDLLCYVRRKSCELAHSQVSTLAEAE